MILNGVLKLTSKGKERGRYFCIYSLLKVETFLIIKTKHFSTFLLLVVWVFIYLCPYGCCCMPGAITSYLWLLSSLLVTNSQTNLSFFSPLNSSKWCGLGTKLACISSQIALFIVHILYVRVFPNNQVQKRYEVWMWASHLFEWRYNSLP